MLQYIHPQTLPSLVSTYMMRRLGSVAMSTRADTQDTRTVMVILEGFDLADFSSDDVNTAFWG